MLSISLRACTALLFLALMCLMPGWPRDINAAEVAKPQRSQLKISNGTGPSWFQEK